MVHINTVAMASWREGMGQLHSLNFSLSGNFRLVGKYFFGESINRKGIFISKLRKENLAGLSRAKLYLSAF